MKVFKSDEKMISINIIGDNVNTTDNILKKIRNYGLLEGF